MRSSDGEWQGASCEQRWQFACEAVPEPGLPSQCEPRVFEDHDYLFCDLRPEWAEARDACMAQGMDLAVIDSAAENAFVAANLPDGAWIGASVSAQEGEWRWAAAQTQFWQGDRTGSPVDDLFAGWHCYQPYECGADTADCARIDFDAVWWVSSCTTDREYVCEKFSLCVPRTDAGVPLGEDVTCDGVDDDCDGLIDENYATTCGAGQCGSTGTKTCVAGAEQDSCEVGALGVDDVSCDGVENNCDGSTDEGFVATSTACGLGICSATGATSCVAGAVQDSCVAGAALADDSSCDGLDGDCYGLVDEDAAAVPSTCGQGACVAVGIVSCQGGALLDSCVPAANCEGDRGNGADDDGDGLVDCADLDCTGAVACQEVCDDGVDNDLNGVLDCADPDCADATNCIEACDELIDNDQDGFLDCGDSDCADHPFCLPESNCVDGLDDDDDGAVDCADLDCAAEAACLEVCDDSVDNDLDGFVDCGDPDCNGLAGCLGEACGNSLDDDGDGLFDCADLDCETHPLCTVPPVDPATIAPPIVQGETTGIIESSAFLVEGPDPRAIA